jgi:prepilin-type processing-associated H-X9-DG protein
LYTCRASVFKRGETTRKYGSYAYNRAYGGFDIPSDSTPADKSLSQITLPADTVWFAETVGGGPYDFDFRWPDVASNPVVTATAPRKLASGPAEYIIERHHGRTNVLWCDGHVKSASLDLLARKNSRNVMYYFTVQDDQTE